MPPEPETPPAEVKEEAQFGFDGFSIDRILFETGDRVEPEPGETSPEEINYEMKIAGKVWISEEKKASRIKLSLAVIVDPKWKPYRIEVDILGRFSLLKGPVGIFDQFTRLAAPPILFPFVREAIYRVTRDSRFGALLIKPVNVREMLKWEIENPQPTLPTVPLPPSVQSTSVATDSKP